MTEKLRTRVSITVLLISAATWMMFLACPWVAMTHVHLPGGVSGRSLNSSDVLLVLNSLATLAAGWALMLIAMMLPTLIAPIHHVLDRSFKRRRARSVVLFLLGYTVIWMVAGGLLHAIKFALHLLAPEPYLLSAGVALGVIVWQCSPTKQRCLNREHNHPELAAFGIAADWDALRFGTLHGIWCVGSCWALMLFTILLSHGHLAAMAAVTFLMISESLEQPRLVRWRLRGPGRLCWIIVAQTRIRARALRPV
jgi:predicted metal-binding membrane protein